VVQEGGSQEEAAGGRLLSGSATSTWLPCIPVSSSFSAWGNGAFWSVRNST